VKINSLQDLKSVQKQLAEAQARAAAEAAAKREAERRAQAGRELFARAVGPVQPLPDRRKHHHPPVPVEPIPVQRQRDEQAVLREALSDGFDASSLLDTDDALSFRRPGVGVDVTRSARSTCMACVPTKRATRWAVSSARRISWACAACAWCTARGWVHRARHRC
jgi:hypothetical protein